jgi:peptide chain release factor
MWIQISAVQDLVECQKAVSLFLKIFIEELDSKNIKNDIISFEPGENFDTYKSVLIQVNESKDKIPDIEGNIQWISDGENEQNQKRKNLFINVEYFEEPSDSDFCKNDIEIKTTKNREGGLNVNRTETSVKITHIPSGISVIAREERTQHLNKKLALSRIQKITRHMKKNGEEKFEKNKHDESECCNPKRVYENNKLKSK